MQYILSHYHIWYISDHITIKSIYVHSPCTRFYILKLTSPHTPQIAHDNSPCSPFYIENYHSPHTHTLNYTRSFTMISILHWKLSSPHTYTHLIIHTFIPHVYDSTSWTITPSNTLSYTRSFAMFTILHLELSPPQTP